MTHSGDHSIGIKLPYQVKEGIRKSIAYRLSSTDDPRHVIDLVTMDSATVLL